MAKYFLAIGSGRYKEGAGLEPLVSTQNDIDNICKAVEPFFDDVIRLEDKRHFEIMIYLEKVLEMFDAKKDWLVVYYTGYENFKDNDVYFSAANTDVSNWAATSLSFRHIQNSLQKKKVSNCLLMLDTCLPKALNLDDQQLSKHMMSVKLNHLSVDSLLCSCANGLQRKMNVYSLQSFFTQGVIDSLLILKQKSLNSAFTLDHLYREVLHKSQNKNQSWLPLFINQSKDVLLFSVATKDAMAWQSIPEKHSGQSDQPVLEGKKNSRKGEEFREEFVDSSHGRQTPLLPEDELLIDQVIGLVKKPVTWISSGLTASVAMAGFLMLYSSGPLLQENVGIIPISKMVDIAGGSLTVDCKDSGVNCQKGMSTYQISIQPFSIGATEVTFEQYDYYCRQVPKCTLPDDKGWGRGDRPVINVSWKETVEYIQWLNAKTGENYRLPTEREWEFAARAKTSSAYSWGDTPNGNYGNGNQQSGNWPQDGHAWETAPVATYKPNNNGLFDVHGNVWEWCKDTYHEKDWLNNQDSESIYRVLRGGSWFSEADSLKSRSRYRGAVDYHRSDIGFRLAKG